MGENLAFEIREAFELREQDIKTYSPLTLAYIGDTVFDVVIRTLIIEKGNCPVNKLHKMASSIVNAASQSAMAESLSDYMTEEELDIYRRGKSSKPHTKAKNASTGDYLRATGFEAVLGYLYLLGKSDRILEIVKEGLKRCQKI